MSNNEISQEVLKANIELTPNINMDDDVIIINKDKLKNYLRDYNDYSKQLKNRFYLVLTIGIALLTSQFQTTLGITGDYIRIAFILMFFALAILLLQALVIYFSSTFMTTDEFLSKCLKKESISKKWYQKILYLFIHF